MNGHTTEYGIVRVTGRGRGVLTTGAGRRIPIRFQEAAHGQEFRDNPDRTHGLDGVADFDLVRAQVTWFLVLRINEYREVPILQAFEELREVLGPDWDPDAAEEYFRSCRSD